MDHNHTHGGAKIRVAAEFLGRAEANQYRQKGKGSAGKEIYGGGQTGPLGIGLDERLASKEVRGQNVVDAHQKAPCHDGRDDGNENVAEHLDEALEGIALFFLRLLLGFLSGAQLLLHLRKYQVHGSGTKDNLKLGLSQEDAFHPFDIANGLFVSQVVVLELQAQSGGAVGRGADVVSAADVLDDLSGNFCIIHKSVTSLCVKCL